MSIFTGRCAGLVVLTRGSKPLLFGRAEEQVRSFSPLEVETGDTTGAGDSSRAGLIYGMLNGYDDVGLIETASVPGVLNSPTVDELGSFLSLTR